MYIINRAVITVKIKQLGLDWVNTLDGLPDLLPEHVNDDTSAYLIGEYDTPEEMESILEELYEGIFEQELMGYYTDRSVWPEITYEKFCEWFDIEEHTMVFDPLKDKIKKSKF